VYREYYGFSRRPFANTPDPAFLYQSKRHAEALARLQYAVEERELALLIGEVGAGKTTLSRALMDACGDNARFFLVTNTRLPPTELLRTLARLLGEAPAFRKAELLDQIQGRLAALYDEGINPVFVLDEAQLMPKPTLDEIRLLTNFQMDDLGLLTILLMGQPELARRLKHPAYEPLLQRVGLRFYLGALLEEEIPPYLAHRLTIAGGDPGLFDPAASPVFMEVTRGIPRLINTLATLSMMEGMQAEADRITPEMVRMASAEMRLPEKE
jgi:type II secretory pathway predicted ATPase ExeA